MIFRLLVLRLLLGTHLVVHGLRVGNFTNLNRRTSKLIDSRDEEILNLRELELITDHNSSPDQPSGIKITSDPYNNKIEVPADTVKSINNNYEVKENSSNQPDSKVSAALDAVKPEEVETIQNDLKPNENPSIQQNKLEAASEVAADNNSKEKEDLSKDPNQQNKVEPTLDGSKPKSDENINQNGSVKPNDSPNQPNVNMGPPSESSESSPEQVVNSNEVTSIQQNKLEAAPDAQKSDKVTENSLKIKDDILHASKQDTLEPVPKSVEVAADNSKTNQQNKVKLASDKTNPKQVVKQNKNEDSTSAPKPPVNNVQPSTDKPKPETNASPQPGTSNNSNDLLSKLPQNQLIPNQPNPEEILQKLKDQTTGGPPTYLTYIPVSSYGSIADAIDKYTKSYPITVNTELATKPPSTDLFSSGIQPTGTQSISDSAPSRSVSAMRTDACQAFQNLCRDIICRGADNVQTNDCQDGGTCQCKTKFQNQTSSFSLPAVSSTLWNHHSILIMSLTIILSFYIES